MGEQLRYLIIETGNPTHTPAWVVNERGEVVRKGLSRDEIAEMKASGTFCDGIKADKPPVSTYYGHCAWKLA